MYGKHCIYYVIILIKMNQSMVVNNQKKMFEKVID